MSNKLNILYDGNHYCFKCVSVYEGIDGKKLFQLEKERESFLRLLTYNFLSEIYKFKGVIDKIIFVRDSKSWRYNFYDEYKSNRELKPDINWDNFQIVVNEFYKILSDLNIIVSRVEEAEGDDMIFGWVNYFKNNNESCVILSSDRDLLQLLYHVNNNFCIQYDSRYSTIFGLDSFNTQITKERIDKIVDIFSISDDVYTSDIDSDIKKTITALFKKGNKFISIDVNQFVLEKILKGDKGDTVPAAYSIVKNKKTYGIGDKSLGIICELLKNNNITLNKILDESAIDPTANIIYDFFSNKKSKVPIEKDCTLDDVIKNIKRNIKIMYLSDKTIPQDLLSRMNESINSIESKEIDFRKMVSTDVILEKYITVNKMTYAKLF